MKEALKLPREVISHQTSSEVVDRSSSRRARREPFRNRKMAASFWESTQRKHWQFTKPELLLLRQKLEAEDPALVQTYPLPPLSQLSIFFNHQMLRLAKRLSVRQQAIATGQLYLRRFYTKIEIRRTNPYLVIATALYLACKMEEAPQHIRLIVSESRSLWPEFFTAADTSKVGECEFFLISEMNSQLIVHQPYRSLNALQAEFGLNVEETQLAQSIINDHYMTDLPLLVPPHIVGLTAILLVLVPAVASGTGGLSSAVHSTLMKASQERQKPGDKKAVLTPRNKLQKFSSWLTTSNIDIESIIDAAQEMIAFYEVQEHYNEKITKEQINRFVKARNLDK